MVEITRLFWKRTFTADNVFLGELESAQVDPNTWQITSFFIGLSDEATKLMGFKRPYLGKITVCLPATTVKSIGDTAVLNQTMEQLRTLKECKE